MHTHFPKVNEQAQPVLLFSSRNKKILLFVFGYQNCHHFK